MIQFGSSSTEIIRSMIMNPKEVRGLEKDDQNWWTRNPGWKIPIQRLQTSVEEKEVSKDEVHSRTGRPELLHYSL